MTGVKAYFFEYLLIAATMLTSVLGFWNIYVGARAEPQPHHHLHLATAFLWMCLLLIQLVLINKSSFKTHRAAGLTVLVAGPLLVATTAMLSVHSAHRGLVSGEGDFLIVQNVMGTIELGLLIFLSFLVKRRRKLHGSLLLSTTILFMGVALFFVLVSFVPQFKIEGPETFYKFQAAAMSGQAICLVVGTFFFVRDFRTGWPFLLAAFFFVLNEVIRFLLTRFDLIDSLTEFIGSMSKLLTFVWSFAILLSLLAATILPIPRRRLAT